ncbi:MAG: glycosyltransferase family 2 protein [Bacteroidota bacterium]
MTAPTPDSSLYSIIIPVYNSEEIVEKTVRETAASMEANGLRYELILINDASRDRSWEKIRDLAQAMPHITAVNFLKNYGQHTAVYCGIEQARGDFLITMDDDLQNPPSELIKLVNKINEGYDLVFGKFPVKQHGGTRKLGSKVIGYLNTKNFQKPKDITLTNFRIFTRATAERVRNYNTFYPYIPGLLLMFSSRIANTATEHHPRTVGKSNYSLWKIAKLVARLLFNYSSYPLKVLTTVGFFISALSFMAGVGFIVKNLVMGVTVQGWTTLVVLISFLCGFILIMLGVMGEYIARIMNQLSVSGSYHIKEVVEHER